MRENPVKRRLQAGESLMGVLLGFNSPAFVELTALAGFDFVLIDCEHGPMDLESVEGMVRAAEAVGLTPLARVPHNEASVILRFLDVGVMGLLVPHIETADDARRAVVAMKYPPDGERGLATVRANSYGVGEPMVDYVRRANQETLFMALVESRKGVENAAEIAAVPGVDVVQIGPNDLSMSMGHYGRSDDPEVQAAIDRVIAAALAAGKAPGSGAIRGPAAIRRALDRGIRVITYGAKDVVLDAGRSLMAEFRKQ